MKSRPFVNFFQIASLLMALVTVALLAAITTMHFAIHGAEVQVPDLKGMTVPDARSETAGLGLSLDVDNRYYSGDVATGHILSQSPEPGTVVRREWKVRVAESLGPQKVDVPDMEGKEERVAALSLRRAGWSWERLPACQTLDRRRGRFWHRIRRRMPRALRGPASTCWWPRPTAMGPTRSLCPTWWDRRWRVRRRS